MTKEQSPKWQFRFLTIWTGQSISLISSELVQFALVWWLIDNTKSATALSIATMLAILPQAIIGPLSGALVDRWNRRKVMIFADTGIALALVWLSYNFASGRIQVWHIYVVILLRAIGNAFHMPAMLSSTSLMVPQKHLSRFAGMNQMMNGIVMVAVPPLGAILFSILSISQIVAFDIAGALLAVLPLLFIPIPQPEVNTYSVSTKSVWQDMAQGFQYIKHWRGAIGMLGISTMINFIMRPSFQLIAVLVVSHFGGDETAFGWMAAAMGAGFVAGGLVLSIWGGFQRKMQTSLMGIVGAGLAILVVGLSPQAAFSLGAGGIFLAGFMMPLCMGPIQALVQSTVDPSMQGRVFTIMNSASTLISPISLGIAGPIFDSLGPLIWYQWGGVLAVVIGLVGFASPVILNLGTPEEKVITETVHPQAGMD